MSSYRSTLIHGGGAAFLFLIILIFLSMATPFGAREAQAQGAAQEYRTSLGGILASSGAGTWLIILLGLAAILLTVIGAIAVQKEKPWPHWRHLVRGLGEAAFLIGIFSCAMGLISAFNEITRLGANVTPKDLSRGLSMALVSLLFGTFVSIATLICAGVLRLFESKPAEQ